MESPRKIKSVTKGSVGPSPSAVKSILKSSPAASPRKTDQQKKKEPKSKMADELKKAVVNAPTGVDNESGKLTKVADGRYGSKGGGDSLLRLPLECLTRKEVKAELKKSQILLPGYPYVNDDDDEEDNGDDDEIAEAKEDEVETEMGPDRARFNVWKGQNYDLHLLGEFKSDFEKKVQSFQKPDMEQILMDPFCRNESGLVEEPPTGKAFLVWKSKSDRWDPKKAMAETGNLSRYPVLATSSSSSGDDEEGSDADSLPDPDMKEYIRNQRKKREDGESLTGETIYFDSEFGVLRNLHRDSHSLTSYGGTPDEKWIGKAHIFYPEMTDEEKSMLTARTETDKTLSRKKSSTTISARTPRKKQPKDKANSEDLAGQYPEKKINSTDHSAGDATAHQVQP